MCFRYERTPNSKFQSVSFHNTADTDISYSLRYLPLSLRPSSFYCTPALQIVSSDMNPNTVPAHPAPTTPSLRNSPEAPTQLDFVEYYDECREYRYHIHVLGDGSKRYYLF